MGNQDILNFDSRRDKLYGRQCHLPLRSNHSPQYPGDPHITDSEEKRHDPCCGLSVFHPQGFAGIPQMPQSAHQLVRIHLGWRVGNSSLFLLKEEGGAEKGRYRVGLLACLHPINKNSSKVKKRFVFHGDTEGSLPCVQINIYLGR